MGKVSKALNKSTLEPKTESLPDDNRQRAHLLNGEFQPDIPARSPPVRTQPRKKAEEPDTSSWEERLNYASNNVTGVSEGIRKLRGMLLYDNSGKKIKSVMILSSSPQEGKSFVCANIGISIAKSVEHQALLLDCDLRRPSLHKLFGIEKGHGLAEFLNNGNGQMSQLIRETGLPELKLLPAGSPPANPAELLSSDKMARVIEELTNQQRNRLVILDTPPFHAASETILLSRLVDKVVLVVRWGVTSRENILKMVETIGREKIIGAVFNAFEMNILDRKVQGVGYNNYYSEYY